MCTVGFQCDLTVVFVVFRQRLLCDSKCEQLCSVLSLEPLIAADDKSVIVWWRMCRCQGLLHVVRSTAGRLNWGAGCTRRRPMALLLLWAACTVCLWIAGCKTWLAWSHQPSLCTGRCHSGRLLSHIHLDVAMHAYLLFTLVSSLWACRLKSHWSLRSQTGVLIVFIELRIMFGINKRDRLSLCNTVLLLALCCGSMRPSVSLSIHLSITSRCCIATAKHVMMQTVPHDSPGL